MGVYGSKPGLYRGPDAQVEDTDSNATVQLAQPNSNSTLTNLVCGSDAQTSAKGNSTCIILNNAAGDVNVGQDAQGNQTSSAENNSNGSNDEIDDVLATLSEGE